MFYFILSFFLVGCGFFKTKEADKIDLPMKSELQAMYDVKLEVAKTSWAKNLGSWPDDKDCDGLLWAGLAKASGVKEVDLSLADHNKDGILHRRPKDPCWTPEKGDQGARSTISRDMVLGFVWGTFASKDADLLKRFAARTEDNGFVMGSPFPERSGEVFLTANLAGAMGRVLCENFNTCPLYRYIRPVFFPMKQDFVKHLTVLYLLLDTKNRTSVAPIKEGEPDIALPYELPSEEIQTPLFNSEVEILKLLADENPKDALFQHAKALFTDGNQSYAAALLMDSNYEYPSYVRGAVDYKMVHWLFTAKQILDSVK